MLAITPGLRAQYTTGLSVGLAVTAVAAGLLSPSSHGAGTTWTAADGLVRLSALVSEVPSTVLTLEAGIIGAQHRVHLTPVQLQGALCAAPNDCQPVEYTALPGLRHINAGAAVTQAALDALPVSEPVKLFGYSEGAQVTYALLRNWASNPSTAPDPSQVSWVSIGNPDNRYGGIFSQLGIHAGRRLPATSPYGGVEVIRQYDGWADWPTNSWNLLADLNALIGMFTVHPDYTKVNLDSPDNRTFTPANPDGSPGNVTYVWVPTPTLPLVSVTGPLAPALDKLLRPIIESAYRRPVALPRSAKVQTPAPSPAAAAIAPTRTAPARTHAQPRRHPTAATVRAASVPSRPKHHAPQ